MPTGAADVAHLLRRAGFGGDAARIAQLAALDLTAVVDAVLDTTANPADDPPVEFAQDKGDYERFVALTQQWYDRMATSPTPIVEKMTLFWHGHFTTQSAKVYMPTVIREQISLYRKSAAGGFQNSPLGDFQALAQAMAVNPAMLMYLDNDRNVKGAPNQNFGRELLELFLLGVGNYTEADVEAAAKAWTGHSVTVVDADRTATYVFNANRHDTSTKTFLGKTGNLDGPDTITHIFTDTKLQMIMAKFIAAKLWTFFAFPDPPAAIVDALAAVFIASNFQIKALLRALFLRTEFYSPAAKLGLVRSPVEWVVAILRGSGLAAGVLNPQWRQEDMGQELFNPPNVAGWKNNLYWISPSAAGAREQFVDDASNAMANKNVLINDTKAPAAQAISDAIAQFQIMMPAAHTTQVLTSWITAQRASKDPGAEPGNLARLVMLSPDLQMA